MINWQWFLNYGIWLLLILVVGGVAYLALRRGANRFIDSLIRRFPQIERSRDTISHIFANTVLVIWLLAILITLMVVVLPWAGISMQGLTSPLKTLGAEVLRWLVTHGVRIAVVLGLGFVLQRILGGIIPSTIQRAMEARARKNRESKIELDKRSETLKVFLTKLVTLALWIIFSFVILSEIGLDIAPLLAGAGVVGLAVAFGSQTLIKDILHGILIIVENQYGKGDVIKVNGIAGGVEELFLRRTLLRDLDGARHIIPNGEIRTVSNLTQEWARAHLDISVAYGEDLDRCMGIMKNTWEELAADPAWSQFITAKTPSVLRVNRFGDSGIDLKIVGETLPAKQWDIMGEYRRRIKRVFDNEGIEIPWPHIKLYAGDPSARALLSRYGQSSPPSSSHSGEGSGSPGEK
ncbi:MAG: mechanosensitive ion channel family protein [Dehalococcoidia bacterium]|nr:mechanosensitive ion channel family protein [Dehalococcoidia bacterium]MDZ4245699.1 mechanosensitive ion channel family protein [Dehalococcoidia bacterium]